LPWDIRNSLYVIAKGQRMLKPIAATEWAIATTLFFNAYKNAGSPEQKEKICRSYAYVWQAAMLSHVLEVQNKTTQQERDYVDEEYLPEFHAYLSFFLTPQKEPGPTEAAATWTSTVNITRFCFQKMNEWFGQPMPAEEEIIKIAVTRVAWWFEPLAVLGPLLVLKPFFTLAWWWCLFFIVVSCFAFMAKHNRGIYKRVNDPSGEFRYEFVPFNNGVELLQAWKTFLVAGLIFHLPFYLWFAGLPVSFSISDFSITINEFFSLVIAMRLHFVHGRRKESLASRITMALDKSPLSWKLGAHQERPGRRFPSRPQEDRLPHFHNLQRLRQEERARRRAA
jgi:hypothetical protein